MEMLCQQLRENAAELSQSEIEYITELKNTAIAFIQHYEGIDGVDNADENGRKLDDYPDLVYVLLALVAHMYDNRQMTIDTDKLNPLVMYTLGLHDFNIVPRESVEA